MKAHFKTVVICLGLACAPLAPVAVGGKEVSPEEKSSKDEKDGKKPKEEAEKSKAPQKEKKTERPKKSEAEVAKKKTRGDGSSVKAGDEKKINESSVTESKNDPVKPKEADQGAEKDANENKVPARKEAAGRERGNRGRMDRRPQRNDKERGAAADRKNKEKSRPQPAEEIAEAAPVLAPEEEKARKASKEERQVTEATNQLEQRVKQTKLKVAQPEEAKSLINEILGAASALSVAERRRATLEDRGLATRVPEGVRPNRPVERFADDERREAVDYLTRRLRGEDVVEPQILQRRTVRDQRPELDNRRDAERREPLRSSRPYFNDGRRYASYRSRSDIPAVLLASAVLNRVAVSNFRDVPYLQSGQVYRDPQVATWVSRPPTDYRGDDAQVVSYKVVEDSMINRDDVLFLQGSTQFVDPRSYNVIEAIAQAMSDPSVKNQRFVVEGHASREGSYDANMALSQRRAERIVRDIVRAGISPERLIPVGYGESEARAAANAPEYLRQRDRRVVVFGLDETP